MLQLVHEVIDQAAVVADGAFEWATSLGVAMKVSCHEVSEG